VREILSSSHPEIDDYHMEHPAISGQLKMPLSWVFLKAESEMLIPLIRK
jgi:hypothetical protein